MTRSAFEFLDSLNSMDLDSLQVMRKLISLIQLELNDVSKEDWQFICDLDACLFSKILDKISDGAV